MDFLGSRSGMETWNADQEQPGGPREKARPSWDGMEQEREGSGPIQQVGPFPWEAIPAELWLSEGGEEDSEEEELPWERGKLEDLLQDLKNELEKRQAKNASQIPEVSHRQEEKDQQLDAKSSISRCGKVTFQLPLEAAPVSEERICHFSWRSNALKETLRKLQATVTLDPNTAHPELVLSEDGKSVRRGAGPRDLPDTPERFDYWPFVLGHQGFVAGRHCWAVDVGAGGDWAVGVARDSIPRKGRLSLGPQGGIWGVEKWGGQVRALTPRKATPVPLRGVPRRVRVHLDCSGGTVAFFDAEEGGLLFLFSRVSFAGERVRPWLWVVGAKSQLRLCP